MKAVFLLLILSILLCKGVVAQECKDRTKYVSGVLVWGRDCESSTEIEPSRNGFGGYTIRIYTTVEVRLDKLQRQSMITGLNKALSWVELNKSKNLSFSKRITEVSTSSRYVTNNVGSNYSDRKFNRIEVVMEASSTNEWRIVFYGKYIAAKSQLNNIHFATIEFDSPAFNIEKPGSHLLSFESESSIREFISILQRQSQNIDAIFK